MSSNEESDDEFQSADEDIEFEPNFKHELENKNNDSEDLKTQTSGNFVNTYDNSFNTYFLFYR